MDHHFDHSHRDPGIDFPHRSVTEDDLAEHREQLMNAVQVLGVRRHSQASKSRYDHHYKEISEYGDEDNLGDADSAQHKVAVILNDPAYANAQSHQVFSEMAELRLHRGDLEWRESARWLSFEEHVEQGGKRWSKPYVATLPLHSVFETRGCLLNGAVLLDVGPKSLEELAELIVDHLVHAGQLDEELKSKVKGLLLTRHHHLQEVRIDEKGKKKHKANHLNLLPHRKKYKVTGVQHTNEHSNTFCITPNLDSHNLILKGNEHFRQKMTPEVEAANILVAEQHLLTKPLVVFLRLSQSCQLGDLCEVPIPTRFLFLLMGPEGHLQTFRDVGRTLGAMFSDEIFRDVAYKAKNREDLLAGMDEFIDAVMVLPPAEWDPKIRIEPPQKIPTQEQRRKPSWVPEEIDSEEEEEIRRREMGLVRTGRLFGGLIDDVKRKLPWYWSDFKDVMAIQSIAAILFLFFATLTPIITFGGLLDMVTNGNIAVIESLVSAFISGVLYGFFSGQPLSILNTTGPVLVFEGITYMFCHECGIHYLEFRCWIGIWTFVLMVVLVAFECSAYVCYITRFTEENFALLIAMVYIHQACEKMFIIGYSSPLQTHPGLHNFTGATIPCIINSSSPEFESYNDTSFLTLDINSSSVWNSSDITIEALPTGNITDTQALSTSCVPKAKYVPDVLLMACIEFFGTFMFVLFLKAFRSSPFFPFKVRQILSDFAVVIAIAVFTIFDDAIGLNTPKLNVPDSFTPTRSDRTWFVHPYHFNPWWTIIAAILPAMLATILIFMDQMITAVIMNRKENLLKKGPGYHLDLLVLGFLILINSFVGVPWLVAGTVVAITHVNALKMESEVAAPGEKPQFLGVREQRVTQIMIFILIGASVGMVKMLTYIPMPVLFGVFMYMGTSPLNDMHFFNRLLLFIIPIKYQPDYPYLRHVRLWRVHMFTMIQLVCMVLLWVVKLNKTISIGFPFMLVIMVGVRKCLDYVFTHEELKVLDDLMPGSTRPQKKPPGPNILEGGNSSPAEKMKKFLKFGHGGKPPTHLNGHHHIHHLRSTSREYSNGDISVPRFSPTPTPPSGLVVGMDGQRYILADAHNRHRSGMKDPGSEDEHMHLTAITDYIDEALQDEEHECAASS